MSLGNDNSGAGIIDERLSPVSTIQRQHFAFSCLPIHSTDDDRNSADSATLCALATQPAPHHLVPNLQHLILSTLPGDNLQRYAQALLFDRHCDPSAVLAVLSARHNLDWNAPPLDDDRHDGDLLPPLWAYIVHCHRHAQAGVLAVAVLGGARLPSDAEMQSESQHFASFVDKLCLRATCERRHSGCHACAAHEALLYSIARSSSSS